MQNANTYLKVARKNGPRKENMCLTSNKSVC